MTPTFRDLLLDAIPESLYFSYYPESVSNWFWAGAGLVIMARMLLNFLLDQLTDTHLSSLTEQHFPLERLGSLCTNMLETKHQSILSILAFAHGHILGWPGVAAVEDKFILHRLAHARSSLSLATDPAFTYASDWFCVGMCGLLDWKNSLPGFLVFT
jgi:hypothetical protein